MSLSRQEQYVPDGVEWGQSESGYTNAADEPSTPLFVGLSASSPTGVHGKQHACEQTCATLSQAFKQMGEGRSTRRTRKPASHIVELLKVFKLIFGLQHVSPHDSGTGLLA